MPSAVSDKQGCLDRVLVHAVNAIKLAVRSVKNELRCFIIVTFLNWSTNLLERKGTTIFLITQVKVSKKAFFYEREVFFALFVRVGWLVLGVSERIGVFNHSVEVCFHQFGCRIGSLLCNKSV